VHRQPTIVDAVPAQKAAAAKKGIPDPRISPVTIAALHQEN
jgi:hypothetical protein